MAERIGLNGWLALCTLGKSYKMPGLEPVGVKRSYSSSEIMLSFLRESRKLRRCCSRRSVVFSGSDKSGLNFEVSARMSLILLW